MTHPRRYLRLYRVFARNNVVREMEFRGNFWAKLLTSVGWVAAFAAIVKLIFANTTAVAGWTEGELFLLFGTFLLVRSLMDMLFTQSLGKIPELVRMGTMDFVLTKPVSSQFYVSARYLSLDEAGTFLAAWLVLGYAWSLLRLPLTAAQVGAWLFLVACGLAILYAINMLLMTLAFWLVRIDNLSALTDTIVFVARYPPDIFPRYLAFAVTYLLPLAFVAAIPTGALKEGVHAATLCIATGMAALFLFVTSLFWRYATRSYTSASS